MWQLWQQQQGLKNACAGGRRCSRDGIAEASEIMASVVAAMEGIAKVSEIMVSSVAAMEGITAVCTIIWAAAATTS